MIHDRLSIETWVTKTRFRFSRYGVWLVGGEPNTHDPGTFASSLLRVLIVRLSSYHYVAPSMSHGLLGQLSSDIDDVFVDYAFMPFPREAELMVKAGIPPLFGTTTKRPYSDFDVIAISNSIAQELFNLPWMLSNSGIPLDSEARLSDDTIPIIIMGGANAQSAFIACAAGNGKDSSMVDGLYFGEAELFWKDSLVTIKQMKGAGSSKKEIVRVLNDTIPALYFPQLRDETVLPDENENIGTKCSAIVSDTDSVRSLVTGPVWYDEETLGYSNVSIDFGCPFLCRFCKEAWEKKPYRMRSPDEIVADIRNAKRNMGLDTVNLFSFNFTSHKDAYVILERAREIVAHVQIKSQRFDGLVKNPAIFSFLQGIGKTSFTFGLEGLSDRIRKFLRKNIDAHLAYEAMKIVFEGAVRQIKIFLILTGFEDDRDTEEFELLLHKIDGLRKASKNKSSPFILSVTPLIPMPHTPLEFAPAPDKTIYEKVIKKLSGIAQRFSMILRESISIDEARAAHCLLFAGSGEASSIINASKEHLYHQYLHKPLIKAFMSGLPEEFINRTLSEKDVSYSFPWDFVDTGEEKKKLYVFYEESCRALSGQDDNVTDRSRIDNRHGTRDSSRDIEKAHNKDIYINPVAKTEMTTYWFSVESDTQLAGLPVRYFQVSLARALCMADPELESAYWKPGKATEDISTFPVYGLSFISLVFKSEVKEKIGNVLSRDPVISGSRVVFCSEDRMVRVPGFPVIRFDNNEPWDNKLIYDFLNGLNADSASYDIKKLSDKKAVLLRKQTIKKTGVYSFVWDFGENCLYVVLTGDGYENDYTRHLRTEKLWLESGKPFRLMRWLFSGTASVCPVCASPLMFDSIDAAFARRRLCAACFFEGDAIPDN